MLSPGLIAPLYFTASEGCAFDWPLAPSDRNRSEPERGAADDGRILLEIAGGDRTRRHESGLWCRTDGLATALGRLTASAMIRRYTSSRAGAA